MEFIEAAKHNKEAQMPETSEANKERILIFEPHPDDIAFQIGGSVFKWLAEGKEIMVCTVTKGNNSTFDMNVTSEQIEKIMQREHHQAIKLTGIDPCRIVQWNYNDLGLDPGCDRLPLLADMIKLIRIFKPTTVVTMDPRNQFDEENPDHRLVALTGFEAAAMAAYPNVFREQFSEQGVHQHFVSRIFFYMSPAPDMFVDIAETPLGKKIELGALYDSQLDLMIGEAKQRLAGMGITFPMFDLPKEILWPEMCKTIASETAAVHDAIFPNKPKLQYAEAFRVQYLGIVHKIKGMLPEV
jgi:N-acetylglucosamine malate deacetylase 1